MKSNSDQSKNLEMNQIENGFVMNNDYDYNCNDKKMMVSTGKNVRIVEMKRNSLSENLNKMTKLNSKEESIRKMCKIIRNCSKTIEKERVNLKHDEKIFIEWKEVARRVDRILFVISVLIVEITPLYLFGSINHLI